MYTGTVVVAFSIVKRLFYTDLFAVYPVCNKVLSRSYVKRKVKQLNLQHVLIGGASGDLSLERSGLWMRGGPLGLPVTRLAGPARAGAACWGPCVPGLSCV